MPELVYCATNRRAKLMCQCTRIQDPKCGFASDEDLSSPMSPIQVYVAEELNSDMT